MRAIKKQTIMNREKFRRMIRKKSFAELAKLIRANSIAIEESAKDAQAQYKMAIEELADAAADAQVFSLRMTDCLMELMGRQGQAMQNAKTPRSRTKKFNITRDEMIATIRRCDGNVAAVARSIGCCGMTAYKMVKRMDLAATVKAAQKTR